MGQGTQGIPVKRRYQRSAAAQQYRQWYLTPRWRQIRAAQLKAYPWCLLCIRRGMRTKATVCNHATRHYGDPVKFWNGPFNSLCADCHDIDQQRIENGGKARPALDAEGWPIEV
jgi:5-methylcytosine-specific restriction protein A